jgi:Cytochrome c7 and related cytochrome c/Class III cytochrome C family
MPPIFSYGTNSYTRIGIIVGVFTLLGVAGTLFELGADSSYATNQGVAKVQPVQFSHSHHAGSMGIDCRYCHTAVENSWFANIPPTKTCMNCHSQIWINSPELEMVRASYRTDQSIPWVKIHDLPDFVYFNHSIHVKKGMGCETCHGRVDQMPLVYQKNSLEMRWCLECHRNPEKYVRPRSEVFTMGYKYPSNQHEVGLQLVKEYNIQRLETCNTCHR